MSVAAKTVMELRQITGAGMMDCKKALQETDGDLEKAQEWLRKKGISVAAKKADRETNEGGVGVLIADDQKQGAIVHLACETDFVARNENFQELLALLARQVLANGDADLENQALVEGEGTVGDLLTGSISKMGENLQLIKAQRVVAEGNGIVAGYAHSNGRVGVLTVLGASAAGDAPTLATLGKDVSMHIAASQVSAISEADLDPAEVAKEKEILVAQAAESGKPAEVVEKMVQGRLNKYIKESTLLSQPFVKNPDQTVGQLVETTGKGAGTDLTVTQFVKLQF